MSNILKAIVNIYNNSNYSTGSFYRSRNRANNMGEALEEFIKDSFCNTFNVNDENERLVRHSEIFSYLGNQNNPPDIMLRGGDSIEVKKIESYGSSLALNSSYPKAKLYSNSSMITNACRNAESWDVKDIIYSVGVVNDNNISDLCFVYGEDYAASSEVYDRIKETIKDGVSLIPGVSFSETKELGRVNRVDPLGITYLRVRGMWGIENPFTVFRYIYTKQKSNFNFFAVINTEKYNSFNDHDKDLIESIDDIVVQDVQIKDPNNPALLKRAKLIYFTR